MDPDFLREIGALRGRFRAPAESRRDAAMPASGVDIATARMRQLPFVGFARRRA
jgi:hypothetical protein